MLEDSSDPLAEASADILGGSPAPEQKKTRKSYDPTPLGKNPAEFLKQQAEQFGLKVRSAQRSRAEQDALIRQGKTQAKDSYHLYSGDAGALDLVGDPAKMKAFTEHAAKNYGGSLRELYHGQAAYREGEAVEPVKKHDTHVHVSWGTRPGRADQPKPTADTSPLDLASRDILSPKAKAASTDSLSPTSEDPLSQATADILGGGSAPTSRQGPTALSPSGEPPVPAHLFAEDLPDYAKRYFGGDELKASTYLTKSGSAIGHTEDLKPTRRPPGPQESVTISGKTTADLTPEQQESGLYREWFKARAAGSLSDADELAKTYLKQFPQGEHAQYLKTPLRRRITEKQGSQAGAGAYYPVSEIEQMRAQKIPDAQIAKIVQDSIAHQMGLSEQDVDLLTQKYGKHPLSEIVEPGAGGAKTSLASIVKQGKSNQGLAEFRIEPETVRQILGDRELLHPAEIDREKATNAIKSFGGKEFLQSLGNDPETIIEFPELTAAAKLLANSPRALELLHTITAGGLEHASGVSQTAANIAEGAQHPIRSAHELLSDFISGGHGKKTPSERKGYFDDLSAQLADDAQNIGAKGGKGAILTPKERIALGLIPGLGQAVAGVNPTHEGVRKGVKQVLDMFPIVLAAELGGAPALGALGYAEKAHEGPKAAFMSAALNAGPFKLLSKAPLGGLVGNALREAAEPSAEMVEQALSSGTKQEAIDAAAKLLRRRLIAEVAGITAEKATNAAQFIITTQAIIAAGQGRWMTKDELVQSAVMAAALDAIPTIRAAGEIPGKVRSAKAEALRATGVGEAIDIEAREVGPEQLGAGKVIDIEAREVKQGGDRDKGSKSATVRGQATPRTQEETPQARPRGSAGAESAQTAEAQIGDRNAVKEGDQQKGSVGEHPRVPSGRDVPADEGEIRQGDGRSAGGGGVAPTEAPERPQEIAVGDIVTHPRYGKGADLEVTKVRGDGSLELSYKRGDGKVVTVPVRKGSDFYNQLQRKGGSQYEGQRDDEASRAAEVGAKKGADEALARGGRREGREVDAGQAGQKDRRMGVAGEGSVEKQAAEPATKEAELVKAGEQRVTGVEGIVKRAKEAERRATQEGATDKLTGLQSQSQWEGARARIDADPNTHVARLDFNDLKAVNDQHGHSAGDKYLRQAGKIIREETAKAGLPERGQFRSGTGDEFTLTGPREAVEKATAEIKRRVAEEIDLPTGAKGSVATGVALTDAAADTAMYADKKAMKAEAAERAKALPDVKTRITADHLSALEERLPKMGAAEKARTHERLLAEEAEQAKAGESLSKRCLETGGRFSLRTQAGV